MVFDIEEIKSRIDPTLFIIGGGSQAIDYIDTNYATHNFYRLSVDFARTKLFNKVLKTSSKANLDKLRDELYKYHKAIIKRPSTKTILFKILDLLARHICDDGYGEHKLFRYSANPWSSKERTLDYLEQTLTLCNNINKYKDDPETNNIQTNIWNSVFTQSIWACVYAGLTDEGLYIIQTTEDLIRKVKNTKPTNPVFKKVLDQPTYGRYMMTIYFAKAQIYKQLGKLDKTEEAFEFIAQLYRGKHDNEFKVYWTTGLNRVTEAAIEVYKLNPTEVNKQRALNYYLDTCFTADLEPTETVRERGLITYMLMKYVLDIEVK